MTKIRWFYSDWGFPLTELSSKILSDQYSEDKGSGYILSKSNTKIITGKYIEKKVLLEVLTDPFGNEISNNKTIYNITNFTIKDEIIGLEIINPPRTIKPFLNSLHKKIGLGLVVSDIQVNPLTWLQAIERKNPCIVNSILASGIKAESNGIAKLSMSGLKDIRNEFYNFLKEKESNIDCVKASISLDNISYKVELFKNSTSTMPSQSIDILKEILASSLLSIQQEKSADNRLR